MAVQEPAVYLGIDVGGTNTRIGLFQTLETPIFTLLARFTTHSAYEEQIQQMVAALVENGITSIKGIGVSVGGRMAKDGRSVLVAPNLPDYEGKPFARDLESLYHCPVRLAHDTVCGLLGEKKFGVLRPVERCAYLTLSTGTGAAFQLRKGITTLTVSIEIGHQLLDGNTLHCLCGQVGCLETFTGGKQLEMRLGHTLAQATDRQFWATFQAKLAIGLVNLVQLTRVEMVALSGAIALKNPDLLQQLQEAVDERLRGARLTLQYAQLGENAPLVGAAILLETGDETLLH